VRAAFILPLSSFILFFAFPSPLTVFSFDAPISASTMSGLFASRLGHFVIVTSSTRLSAAPCPLRECLFALVTNRIGVVSIRLADDR